MGWAMGHGTGNSYSRMRRTNAQGVRVRDIHSLNSLRIWRSRTFLETLALEKAARMLECINQSTPRVSTEKTSVESDCDGGFCLCLEPRRHVRATPLATMACMVPYTCASDDHMYTYSESQDYSDRQLSYLQMCQADHIAHLYKNNHL